MTIPAKIDGPGLTEKQAILVAELLKGTPTEEAMALAGYSDATSSQIALSSKAVQDALTAGCDAKLRGELRLKAIRALDELVTSGPAATRFQAAKLILEEGKDDSLDGKKPLSKMTEAELEAVVEDAARKALQLQSIDVEPKTGA